MDYFLDTCVEVGYVFCTDPWNDNSVEVFNDNDYLHYSHTVKKEFNKKYHEIYNENRNFLRSLMDILNLEIDKEKLLSLDELNQKSWQVKLEKEIDEIKKEKIIKTLWEFSKSKHLNTESDNPDAHDLSLKRNIPLEFITADKNMINNVNCIIELLNINNFHYLKDFVN